MSEPIETKAESLGTNGNENSERFARTQRALEAGFRAILTLFAAVLGYGLKHVIDVEPKLPTKEFVHLVQFRWPLFIIALATFSRFLIGTAIHVTYEHIHRGGATSRLTYLQDMMFAASYALLGVGVCYAANPIRALVWMASLHFAAILWAGCDSEVRSFTSLAAAAAGEWTFYLRLNLLVLCGLLLALWYARYHELGIYEQPFAWIPGWNWYWMLVTAGAITALVYDCRCQLKAIGVQGP